MEVSRADYMKRGLELASKVANFCWNSPNTSLLIASVVLRVLRRTLRWFPSKVVVEFSPDRCHFIEGSTAGPFAFLYRDFSCFRAALCALEAAADDPRVSAVVVHIGLGHLGAARIDELRSALLRIREKKPTVAFLDNFHVQLGLVEYWLASACDHIVMSPAGFVTITALGSATPFALDLLRKLGVEPHITKRSDYKTAANMFTNDSMTKQQREQTTYLLEGLSEVMAKQIYEARKDKLKGVRGWEDVEEIIASGPFTGKEAVERGLLDELAYDHVMRDEVVPRLVGVAKALPFRSLGNYVLNRPKYVPHRAGWGKTRIAYLALEGTIHEGHSQMPYDNGGPSIGSTTVVAVLRDIQKHKKSIKALVLRVNSPGGAWTASELIRHELGRVAAAGIPIVVTMSNYAASGGYSISSPASSIVASPMTLTGSVGVITGKFEVTGLLKNVGVNIQRIDKAPNTTLFAATAGLEGEMKKRMEKLADDVYDEFKALVKEGRGEKVADVEEVAQGKVFLGGTARDHGLVDRLGGINEAVDEAAKILNVDKSKIAVVPYPRPLTTLELISKLNKKPKNREEKDQTPNISVASLVASSIFSWLLEAVTGPFVAAHFGHTYSPHLPSFE